MDIYRSTTGALLSSGGRTVRQYTSPRLSAVWRP